MTTNPTPHPTAPTARAFTLTAAQFIAAIDDAIRNGSLYVATDHHDSYVVERDFDEASAEEHLTQFARIDAARDEQPSPAARIRPASEAEPGKTYWLRWPGESWQIAHRYAHGWRLLSGFPIAEPEGHVAHRAAEIVALVPPGDDAHAPAAEPAPAGDDGCVPARIAVAVDEHGDTNGCVLRDRDRDTDGDAVREQVDVRRSWAEPGTHVEGFIVETRLPRVVRPAPRVVKGEAARVPRPAPVESVEGEVPH